MSALSEEGKAGSGQASHPDHELTSSSGLLSSMVDDAVRLAANHSQHISDGQSMSTEYDADFSGAGAESGDADTGSEIERASSSSDSVISITQAPAEPEVPRSVSRADMPPGAVTTMDRGWDGSDSSAGRLAKVLQVSSGVSDSVLQLFSQ